MATLSTLAAAENRCRSQMEAKTWLVAYAMRSFTGAGFCCRFIRPMSPTHPGETGYSEWTETTDDSVD